MSKQFKTFIIIMIVLIPISLFAWFTPIIPVFNNSAYGIPSCKIVEFRSLKYFFLVYGLGYSPREFRDPPKVLISDEYSCMIIN
jgi:hypothetical protein